MPQDAYAGFAERYDRFHGPFGQHNREEVEFFRRLFEEHRVCRVLDCACGTGRHLPLFHSLGCQVAGSDLSPAMLAQAERNLAGIGLRLPLYQVDYRELPQHFSEPFDAVTCLSTSVPPVADEGEVVRAFWSMRSVLRAGGILVITQGTTDRQWKEKPRFLLISDQADFTRLFVIDYLGEGARYNVVDVSRAEGEHELRVWSMEYPRIYLRDDHQRLLEEAGFEQIAFYGTYQCDPYDKKTSQRLIVVAQR